MPTKLNFERTIKFQREADPEWARQVSEHPGCERLFSCLQCGSCTGTCPLSIYMDYGPRRIIGLAREGFRKEVHQFPDHLALRVLLFLRCALPAGDSYYGRYV